MDQLDLVIILAAALAILGGYRLGFLARAFSWVGLALGILVGIQVLPNLLSSAGNSTTSTRFFILISVLFGAAFLGQGLGLALGHAISRSVPLAELRLVDRSLGALLGLAGVLLILWMMIPTMVDAPGWPSRQARNSAIARAIDSVAPAPPNAVQTLRHLVGDNNFPRVFNGLEPSRDAGPPPQDSGLPADVQARVLASTVKVEGVSCGRLLEGSGFVIAPDLVMTNAHVVAGVTNRSLEVMRIDGRRIPGTAEMFDSDRDLALIHVEGLGESPLPIASASPNVVGAVFGHPGGQNDVRVAPAKIRDRINALGRDLYEKHEIVRQIFVLAADLHQGDSGGALVNQSGTVVGVAFAIAPDRPDTAYALTGTEVDAALGEPRGRSVGTGACLAS